MSSYIYYGNDCFCEGIFKTHFKFDNETYLMITDRKDHLRYHNLALKFFIYKFNSHSGHEKGELAMKKKLFKRLNAKIRIVDIDEVSKIESRYLKHILYR